MKKEVQKFEIVNGLFKESHFLGLQTTIFYKDGSYTCKLIEVQTNEKEKNGEILVFGNWGEGQLSSDEKVTLKIVFRNFILTAETQMVFLRESFLMLKVPETVLLSNERTEARTHINEKQKKWVKVILRHNEVSVQAYFSPTNFSTKGIGGEIEFSTQFNLLPGTKILGTYWQSGQWNKIEGTIQRYRRTGLGAIDEEKGVVGITFDETGNLEKKLDNKLRLKELNRKISLHLDFELAHLPGKIFRSGIDSASVSGFSLSVADKTIQQAILIGQKIQRSNSSLRAELVGYDDDNFYFQWVAGLNQDRLIWLKETSLIWGDNIDPLTLKGDEILGLFCQSGAFSNQFIKEYKHFGSEIVDRMEEGNIVEPWIYRWSNRDLSGTVKAYASALKSGDNCWTLADLVSDRYQHKVDVDFTENFTTSFSHFCLELSPCPTQMISWVKDHKYWKKFESSLLAQSDKFVVAQTNMFYTRITGLGLFSAKSYCQFSQIEPGEFRKIDELRNRISKFGLADFADAFDLSKNNFGSAQLRHLFEGQKKPFKREYFQVHISNDESPSFVMILSYFPEGLNPGRYIDSIFLLDLTHDPLDDERWKNLVNSIVGFAGSRGYSTHAIRRLSLNSEVIYATENTTLTTFLLHPQSWIAKKIAA